MANGTFTHRMGLCLAAGSLFTVCTISGPLLARAEQKPELPAPTIHQMMKNVAWNEVQASKHFAGCFRYIQRTISSGGSRTTDEIATSHGDVARLLEVDNHQPDQQQIQKNQQLLAKLSSNRQLQQSRFKDQQSNAQRRDNVIKDMANAFIYTYAGKDRQGLIRLKFRPAPNFQPTSRQSLVLRGMAGEAWVDPKTQRIVKIDGTLIQDVTIGWGFLARLNKGGTFLLEQSEGPDGIWHQKLLSVHFDGTEFIFKHIHIHETEIRCCFEQIPDDLTIQAAVHMLLSKTQPPHNWKNRLEAIQKSADLN